MEPGTAYSGPSWAALAFKSISGSGLRAGAARVAVIEILAADPGSLVSPADLAVELLRSGTAGSRASVYRSLERLRQLDLVWRYDGSTGGALYRPVFPGQSLNCVVEDGSGRVEILDDGFLDSSIGEFAERNGVDLRSHELILRGQLREPGSGIDISR